MRYDANRMNVIKYYGSKAMTYQTIVEQIDTANTTMYIEPFGGGASVLLNKPPHEIEVYNEANLGVYTLFHVLADREQGEELKMRLRDVAYTEETFEEALQIKNCSEGRSLQDIDRRIAMFIRQIQKKYNSHIIKDFEEAYRTIEREGKDKKAIEEQINAKGTGDEKLNAIIQNYGLTEEELYYGEQLYQNRESMIRNQDYIEKKMENIDEIDIAKANFIAYNMSWNGMCDWFAKRDGQKSFEKKVEGLSNVMQRLQNVVVLNEDAFDLLDRERLNEKLEEKGVNIKGIYNSKIIYYLDPPYVADERIARTKSEQGKNKINPGDAYFVGKNFNHIELLEKIKATDCMMMVSNYRDENRLYDTYLSEQNGWRTIEFETKTTISNVNMDRTEVLWKNF